MRRVLDLHCPCGVGHAYVGGWWWKASVSAVKCAGCGTPIDEWVDGPPTVFDRLAWMLRRLVR